MRIVVYDFVDVVLVVGLKDLWYFVCLFEFVVEKLVLLCCLGKKFVFWCEFLGKLYVLEDYCLYCGVLLFMGIFMGDCIVCGYYGVQVCFDGVVISVFGSFGCKLEGVKVICCFYVIEVVGVIFFYNSLEDVDMLLLLCLFEELISFEYFNFLCYIEWKGDYCYVLDNVMDLMYGIFLYKQLYFMVEGDNIVSFGICEIDIGFVFEKEGQCDVNFDWIEWGDIGLYWMCLVIFYFKIGGFGGSFVIIGSYMFVVDNIVVVFYWCCCKFLGWQCDIWCFFYCNCLEVCYWNVLEQDWVVLELMELDVNQCEMLYQYDMGIVCLCCYLCGLVKVQLVCEEELVVVRVLVCVV